MSRSAGGLLRRLLALLLVIALGGLLWKRILQQPAFQGPNTNVQARARESIDPSRVVVLDGDTILIRGPAQLDETVRILGIDAPETSQSLATGGVGQPYGDEARSFAIAQFAKAARVDLLRSPYPDRYGRTLAYVFLDGANYSELAVESHLAEETVSRFGHQGFPKEAARVRAAAQRAGPPPFQSPASFREIHRKRGFTESGASEPAEQPEAPASP